MASSMHFAFGPEESFFFYCPLGTVSHRTNRAFSQVVPPGLRARTNLMGALDGSLYSVCLGPGDNEYCAFYKDKEGVGHYSINFQTNEILRPVQEWFVQRIKEIRIVNRCRLVLGPHQTYFALTPSKYKLGPGDEQETPATAQTVASLREFLKKRKEEPASKTPMITEAALGYGGAWWVRLADETCRWDMRGWYTELDRLMKDERSGVVDVSYLVLSLFNKNHWFMVFGGNQVRYSLPAGYAKLIDPLIKEYRAFQTTVSGSHLDEQTVEVSGSPSSAENVTADMPPAYEDEKKPVKC